MNYEYNFSKKKYRKKIFFVIPLGLAIAASLCFISFIQGNFSWIAVVSVFPFCMLISVLIYFTKTASKANSKLFFENGVLNYVDVVQKGYTRQMYYYKYKAYHYTVSKIDHITVVKEGIFLGGKIKKTTISIFDNDRSRREQMVSNLVIPNYFENQEHLIDNIKCLSRGD